LLRPTGRSAGGYGQTGFSTLAEAVTDADGRFTIPARLLLNPPLPFPIKGPELAFVRAGYGGWRLVGPESTLTGGGAVIELRPPPTRAARVAYLHGLVGQSPGMQALVQRIACVAPVEVPVLILGESGTGKELVAAALHQLSARRRARFEPVNCGGLPR
jgi:hypothetical protein